MLRPAMMGWMLTRSLLLGGPVAASGDEGSVIELERLENEIDALEGTSVAAPESFRARLDDLRMEIVYLKVKSRKHRQAGGEGSGLSTDEIDEVSREIARVFKRAHRCLRGHSTGRPSQSPNSAPGRCRSHDRSRSSICSSVASGSSRLRFCRIRSTPVWNKSIAIRKRSEGLNAGVSSIVQFYRSFERVARTSETVNSSTRR